MSSEGKDAKERLRAVLDKRTAVYKELAGAKTYGEYLSATPSREDEEILTEPVLQDLMEGVLGFPADRYFPQFSRGGLKPDLTPMDPIAHPFVLDAKSSTQSLASHEKQIRTYIDQRQLDFGVLFNLREIRVYRRGKTGHDPALSFALLPLWEAATGAALAVDPELAALELFVDIFRYREMSRDAKIARIRGAEPWIQREGAGDVITVDIDFLVEQLSDLSRDLAADADASQEDLLRNLKLSDGREAAMLGELEALAQDIEPGTAAAALPDSVGAYMGSETGLGARVWSQYLLRVAQLALARIVLYRAWEDVGFVDGGLYDGGFEEAYDRLDGNLRKVLQRAFAEGLQRYPWLFGKDNNYDWYRPRDEALVDVLYGLIPFPLGKLDADVLGGLYESYVDEIDRDRLGQFYTPRAVVRFMLEQGEFNSPDRIFRLEGDERRPRRVFDFATGSGGFLVEAARRVIDHGGLDQSDEADLFDGLAAIVQGLHGCEISAFPYYLTEINLLMQVSRLLGQISLAGGQEPPAFVLGAVHTDTLGSRGSSDASMEGLTPEQRKDAALLSQDPHFGLVPLDKEKQAAFDRVRDDESFDYVVGNPPYVFEANNRLLFQRLRRMPAWADTYRGKSDYLYYFLTLAVEKLTTGGTLCVITPAGWMNAGNADWLREGMAGELRLDRLFLFGSYRLFAPEREARERRLRAPTPTVESAILIATKAKPSKGHKLRIVALENEMEAAKTLAAAGEGAPDRDRLLDEMARRADGRQGRKGGIHVHDLKQSELVHSRPWPIKHGAKDAPTRVVAHLQGLLDTEDSGVERLAEQWSIPQGIQTGADAYTPRIRQRLERSFPEAKRELELRGAELGAPIMELPAGAEKQEPWKSNGEVLARSIEPTAILYGAMDESEYTSLVWLGRDDDPASAVIDALEPWKPVLGNRAEIRRNPKRRWWETAWPRSKSELRKPKVIALYRTDRGRFALDEIGEWQPSIKTTLVIPHEEGLSVSYVCGLLNSELLDLWYGVRGKRPRDVWRNYEPKPMKEIPYRHVAGIADAEDERLGELDNALGDGDVDRAFALSDELADEIDSTDGGDVLAAAALERLVRSIAHNRRELLPYRDLFPELGRVVKDPWRADALSPDPMAAIDKLDDAEAISVRIDPELTREVAGEGVLGKPSFDGDDLVWLYRKQETARVQGPLPRLELLGEIGAGQGRLLAADLLSLRLPRDVGAFEDSLTELSATVRTMLESGRVLVEVAERLVCRLYGLSSELEDEVVQHAIARAAVAAPASEE